MFKGDQQKSMQMQLLFPTYLASVSTTKITSVSIRFHFRIRHTIDSFDTTCRRAPVSPTKVTGSSHSNLSRLPHLHVAGHRFHMNESQVLDIPRQDHQSGYPIPLSYQAYNTQFCHHMPHSTRESRQSHRFEPLKFKLPPTFTCGWPQVSAE